MSNGAPHSWNIVCFRLKQVEDERTEIIEPVSAARCPGREVDNVCLDAFLCLHNNLSAYRARGVTVSSDSNTGLQLKSIVNLSMGFDRSYSTLIQHHASISMPRQFSLYDCHQSNCVLDCRTHDTLHCVPPKNAIGDAPAKSRCYTIVVTDSRLCSSTLHDGLLMLIRLRSLPTISNQKRP